MTESTPGDKYTALFLQLLMSFQAAAWQQLGKIKNPFTEKIERNLDQARHTIDMLEMLRIKCRSTLSEDEKSFLDRIISELQLNFVAESSRDNSEPETRENPVEKEPEAKENSSRKKNTKKPDKKSAGTEPKNKTQKKNPK